MKVTYENKNFIKFFVIFIIQREIVKYFPTVETITIDRYLFFVFVHVVCVIFIVQREIVKYFSTVETITIDKYLFFVFVYVVCVISLYCDLVT